MNRPIVISGTGVITSSENDERAGFEFHPDDPQGQLLEGFPSTDGKAQLMRSGTFCFCPSKKRIRNNALLICKAAHGRLSGTRDQAVQLTLKCFASEGIDWQRAFLSETIGLMTHVMGEKQVKDCLKELMDKMK